MKKKLFSIVLFLLLSHFSFSLEGIKIQGGLTTTFHGLESSAQIAIKPGFGVSFPMMISDNIIFEPSLYFSTLDIEQQANLIVPIEVEQGDYYLLQFFLMAHMGLAFDVSDDHQFSVMGSLALIPSFPLARAEGLALDPVLSYYYPGLRFVMPGIKGGYAWKFSDSKSLTVDIISLLPLSNLWLGENIVNYFMIMGNIGFLIHF